MRNVDTGYVHTREYLKEMTGRFIENSQEPAIVALIGQVGLVLAERLEAIVNVLEDMEKTL